MENIKEARELVNKIISRGGTVLKTEKRRLVELHNLILDGRISYNVGCQTCIKKAFSRLDDYFKKNHEEAPKKSKPKKDGKESKTEEGGKQESTQGKTSEGTKPKRKKRTKSEGNN